MADRLLKMLRTAQNHQNQDLRLPEISATLVREVLPKVLVSLKVAEAHGSQVQARRDPLTGGIVPEIIV